jgi:2'-5' RNA ligase
MRLFVAIDLPDSVKQQLEEIVTELSTCRADVRWVRSDSMHLTLKFLGNVAPQELVEIDRVLSRIVATTQPTQGRLRNVGSFPHLRRPRVLWIGVETDNGMLSSLQTDLDAALAKIGFSKENRRFRPHITLGRIRGNRRLSALREAVEKQSGHKAGSFKIEHLTLFESRQRRDSTRYTALTTHSFEVR